MGGWSVLMQRARRARPLSGRSKWPTPQGPAGGSAAHSRRASSRGDTSAAITTRKHEKASSMSAALLHDRLWFQIHEGTVLGRFMQIGHPAAPGAAAQPVAHLD